MKKELPKLVAAAALLLLFLFLISSADRSRSIGDRYFRSAAGCRRMGPGFYQESDLQNQVSDLMKQVSDLKKDHDQVSDLKKEVLDLKNKVSDLKHLDHEQVSDSKMDRDNVSVSKKDQDEYWYLPYIIFPAIILTIILGCVLRQYGVELFDNTQSDITVFRLQVGLFGLIRILQKDLNRIAATRFKDTTRFKKEDYVLTETIKALLRQLNSNNMVYAHSSDKSRKMYNWWDSFDPLSDEESLKFNGETIVDVTKFNKYLTRPISTMSRTSNGNFDNEYIVVTIFVAAIGEFKLPSVNNVKDLKQALQKLGSIPSTSIKGVEVLWTPQYENGLLSEREFRKAYPVLQLI